MAKIQKTINIKTKYYLEDIALEITEDNTMVGITTYVAISVTGERGIQLTYENYLNLVELIRAEQNEGVLNG
mgnify:CR=1 FL=1